MGEKANIFQFSCRKATELMEKRTVTKLSVVEKTQLLLHACVCDSCRHYEKQSKLLDNLFKKENTGAFSKNKTSVRLNDEVKKRIIEKLDPK